MSDELVSQFMAFTGSSDVDVAKNYLEMSGNNVETAVGLFMEHNAAAGGGGLGGAGGASAAGDFGGAAAAAMGADIRAPDATRTMRLMDDGSGGPAMGGGLASMLAHDPQVRVMYEMMEEQLARPAFAPTGAVDARRAVNAAAAAALAGSDDDDDDNIQYDYDDDEDENMQDEEDNQGPSQAGLADLFSAPSHLMHKAGGFQGARQVAKDSKRWLLVNIQRDAEFASHALNRDVWRNDLVENLIREGFIFWQEVGCARVLYCRSCVCLFCSAHFFSRYRWIFRSRVASTCSDITCTNSPTLQLSILGRDVSCGRRKDGRRKTP